MLQAYKALQEFRVQIAVIALQVSISEPDEVISLVAAATELEDYIKSGEFSKQGDALERWSRVQQLQVYFSLSAQYSICHPRRCCF